MKCVRVVLSITVCHAVKLMPTGCLRTMGCVRPPKRTAGGPTGMRVYSMGIFLVCVREKDGSSEKRGVGVILRKAFLKKLWLQANQKLRTCLLDQQKKENLSTAVSCILAQAGKYLLKT